MMPSRGPLARRAAASFRQLSTQARTPRPFLPTGAQPKSSLLASKPPSQRAITPRLAVLAAPSIAARFQSTAATTAATTSATPPAATAAPTPVLAQPQSNAGSTTLSNISDLPTDDHANVPEHIGYLKDLGLDYGWGPTAAVEWLLEHIHIYTGTPWWGSIMLTALVVRFLLLKPYINMSDLTARLQALKPIITPIQEKMKEAQANKDTIAVMQQRDELIRAYRNGNIKIWRSFLPMGLQACLGFGTFRLMRGMANLPVPGLETGGFLWLKDLTVADPYLVTPLVMGGILHYLGKKGGEAGTAASMSPGTRNIMVYGLPIIFTATMIPMPACLQLSFVASTSLGIVQSYLLRQPGIRQRLGIAPLVPDAPPAGDSPQQPKLRINYQAPTVESSIAGSGKEPLDTTATKGFLAGAKSEVKGMVKQAQQSYNSLRGVEQQKKGGPSKAFLRRAEEYERRRLKEIEEEKWEREEQQRLERQRREEQRRSERVSQMQRRKR